MNGFNPRYFCVSKAGHDGGCRGFSLIEVTLAVFVIGAAMLILFALFPLGMKEGQRASSDTQEATFADYVLGAMEGNSMVITNWSDWSDLSRFKQQILQDVKSPSLVCDGSIQSMTEYPPGSGNPLMYSLQIIDMPTTSQPGARKQAVLVVKSGKYGTLDVLSRTYITEFYYAGL